METLVFNRHIAPDSVLIKAKLAAAKRLRANNMRKWRKQKTHSFGTTTSLSSFLIVTGWINTRKWEVITTDEGYLLNFLD
jgi:hypothetical protein